MGIQFSFDTIFNVGKNQIGEFNEHEYALTELL